MYHCKMIQDGISTFFAAMWCSLCLVFYFSKLSVTRILCRILCRCFLNFKVDTDETKQQFSYFVSDTYKNLLLQTPICTR